MAMNGEKAVNEKNVVNACIIRTKFIVSERNRKQNKMIIVYTLLKCMKGILI